MRRLGVVRRWVLVDAQSGGVLRVGDQDVAGLSHRSALDVLGVRLLYPSMARGLALGTHLTESARFDGVELSVTTRILRAPFSGVVVGALGLVTPPGEPGEPLPEVGLWEWVVAPGETATRQAYWDPVLARIYGDPVADPAVPRDVAAWFASRLAPASRLRLADLIEQGVRFPTDDLRILGYSIVDGRGGSRAMRLVGRTAHGTGGRVFMRGMSHAVTSPVHERLPALHEPRPELQVLDIPRLDSTAAFMVLDVTYGTFERQAGEGWSALGLRDTPAGDLADLAHPDDHERLVRFMVDIGDAPASIVVRLALEEGGHLPCRLTAVPLSGSVALRQLTCRVVPVDRAELWTGP
ncbi:hypothetical protein [Isoptericola sp. NPDC057191]|uniref:hypothetical protein n=1 Tax=Isoptericola sp. NPDC057191 TaxID=3346041 RepID=UPI0036293589